MNQWNNSGYDLSDLQPRPKPHGMNSIAHGSQPTVPEPSMFAFSSYQGQQSPKLVQRYRAIITYGGTTRVNFPNGASNQKYLEK